MIRGHPETGGRFFYVGEGEKGMEKASRDIEIKIKKGLTLQPTPK